jgi:general secretion pathway protein D
MRVTAKLFAAAALLAAAGLPLEARTRKGDKLMAEGRKAEQRKDWDKALECYEGALAEDPSDAAYLLAVRRVRFQASQAHVDRGQKIRAQGNLQEALLEFQKAFATDPSSAIAQQEMLQTLEMIEREKKKAEPSKPEERGLTPAERARQEALARLRRIEPLPELRPLSRQLINLRMANQPAKVLFETVCKLAGINVIFDPDFRQDPNASRNQSVELVNSTLEQALDYLAVMTRSFWKPLSSNTIFVTNDNQTKRRDYEDYVVKVFYLQNVTQPQDLQEMATNIRALTDIRRVFTSNAQNAIIVRGTADQVALAEKIVHDLDRPKAEVVIDVLVMEANKSKTRDLAASIASAGTAGFSTGILFTPRNPVLLGGSSNTGTTGTTGTDTGATTGTTPTPYNPYYPYGSSPYGYPQYGYSGYAATGSSTANQLISMARIGRLSTNDFSLTLPGAMLQALMTDRSTKVLQSPQIRVADGMKASLRIGDQVPIATGSFQPGIGAVGISPLVNTQFQYKDVGVNVDITPRVHGQDEVTLHVELEISTVRDRIDIGGIAQPVIGQRKAILDLRIREGEVSLIGGLMQDQDTKSVSGVPGLGNIPLLRRLFTSESIERNQSELLIALVPHVVRTPGITDLNLKGVAAGSDTVVRLSYAPPEAPAPEPPKPAQAKPEAAAPQPAPAPAAPPAPKPEAAEPKPAPPPAAAVRLSLRPPSVVTQPGATFSVQLEIENVQALFSAPFRVKFDPQLLRLNEIQAGNLLSGDGKQIVFTRNILNDTGDAVVNLNRMPGAGGISGSGPLAVLVFQAIGRGAASVSFPGLTLRDYRLETIPVEAPQLTVTIK